MKILSLATAVAFMFVIPVATTWGGLISASDNFDGGSSGAWIGDWSTSVVSSIVGGSLSISGNNNNAAVRGIQTISSNVHHTVKVSFDMTFSGTVGTNTFLGFWMGDSNPNSGPNFGVKSGLSGNGDFFGRRNGTSGTYGFGDLIPGDNYTIDAEVSDSNNSGTWDAMRFRVNNGSWVSVAAGSIPGSFTSFDQIGFRTANVGANSSFAIGNLSITAVPEPTALMLVGSVVGLVGLRRRRS